MSLMSKVRDKPARVTPVDTLVEDFTVEQTPVEAFQPEDMDMLEASLDASPTDVAGVGGELRNRRRASAAQGFVLRQSIKNTSQEQARVSQRAISCSGARASLCVLGKLGLALSHHTLLIN